MLLAGVFAELEQKRLAIQVTQTAMDLEMKLRKLASGRESPGQSNGIPELWMNTTQLQCGIESWRAQLGEMMRHLQELSGRWTPPTAESGPAATRAVRVEQWRLSSEQPCNKLVLGANKIEKEDPATMATLLQLYGIARTDDITPSFDIPRIDEHRDRLRAVSAKMLSRLRVLTHELDDCIRNCKLRADGVMLSANLEIAKSSGRSGKTMERLTFVSMFCLPFHAHNGERVTIGPSHLLYYSCVLSGLTNVCIVSLLDFAL